MVESEVKIRVRLEIDDGDKSAILNQAKTIKETGSLSSSSSPIESPQEQGFRGGIFGDVEDSGVRGFEGRQGIGGGVQRQRDRTSNAPVDLRSEFQKVKDDQNLLKEQTKFMEGRLNEFSSVISDPQGALQSQIFDRIGNNPTGAEALKLIPLIGVALTAPAILDKLFQLLIAPGGPFDKRLKIILADQEEQFLSREQQKDRQLGKAQVVISQGGFGNAQGILTTNTLNQVKATGTADIGLNEAIIGLK